MSASSHLPPGTPCYLVRCVDFPELNGRVVEIVAGPIRFPDEADGPWYAYTASWAPRGEMPCALRRCLQPITPEADFELVRERGAGVLP